MNSTNRRQNRGDEKQASFPNLHKNKPHDKKTKQLLSETPKRQNSKGYKNEEHYQQKKSDDNNRKLKIKEKSVTDLKHSKPTQGDGDTIRDHGKIHKYVFHADDSISLKLLQYNLDIDESMLTLADSKKPNNRRSYYILSAKDVYYEQIKEPEAFQLKVRKFDKDVVIDLVLKGRSMSEKNLWINEFGIKMDLACELLKTCIDEVENRRFCKGQKKRNEVKELREVDIGTLLRALDSQKSYKLKLTNDKRWNVSRIEKLIQVLLSEIPQPLIPFQIQEILERPGSKNIQKDYSRILKRIPSLNHKMLEILMEHLENLTNYYTNQLNSNVNETEKIRKSICARLTPLIIRQEFNKDAGDFDSNNECNIVEKFCTMFYRLMESTDVKKANNA